MNQLVYDRRTRPGGLFKLVATGVCVLLIVDAISLVAVDWIQSRLSMPGMRYLWASKEGAVLGLFISQVLLAATYSSLGVGSSLKRILYSMLVVTMSTFLLQAFTRWWFAIALNDSATIALMVVFYFCLLQIPLWIFRVCSGWRITRLTCPLAILTHLGTRPIDRRRC